jgi:hypothetical protein
VQVDDRRDDISNETYRCQTDQSIPAVAAHIGRIGYTLAMARLTLRLDLGPGQAIGHGNVQRYRAIEAMAHAAVADDLTALVAVAANPASDQ